MERGWEWECNNGPMGWMPKYLFLEKHSNFLYMTSGIGRLENMKEYEVYNFKLMELWFDGFLIDFHGNGCFLHFLDKLHVRYQGH